MRLAIATLLIVDFLVACASIPSSQATRSPAPVTTLAKATVELDSFTPSPVVTSQTVSPPLTTVPAPALQPMMLSAVVGQLGGTASTLAVQDQYAYLGVGMRLLVVELATPTAPRVLGKSELLSGVVQHLALAGNYAYVVVPDRIYAIDVMDPASPRIISVFDINAVTRVAIRGNYAYLATRHCMWSTAGSPMCTGSLRVVNISDLTHLQEVSRLDIQGGVYSIALAGIYAYVIAGNNPESPGGLRVVDVSELKPRLVGSLTITDATSVAVVGAYAYVAGNGLQIIDVSTPTSPRKVGSWGPDTYDDVAVAGGYAYVTKYFCELGACSNNLWLIDVRNPLAPESVQGPPSEEQAAVGAGQRLAVINGLVYWAGDAALEIWDVSLPSQWLLIGRLNLIGPVSNMSVVDGYAYVLAGMPGQQSLNVIAMQNPSQPDILGECQRCAGSAKIAVRGGYAYLGVWEYGLKIIDVRDPSRFDHVGDLKLGEPGLAGIYDIAFLGEDYIVVWLEDQSLRVIDVADPAQPRQVASLMLQVGAYGQIVVVNSSAYLVAGGCGETGCQGQLKLIDLTDPTIPRLLSSLDIPGARAIAVANRYAYVSTVLCYYAYSSCTSKLWMIDIADLTQPRPVGFLTVPQSSPDIAAWRNYVYWGQRIFDVSDPKQPREIGISTALEGPKVVVDDYLYVAGRERGLLVLRLSSKEAGGS